MTDRAWLTVFATLADVFVLSQPYDAKGAFMLLHAIDDTLDGIELRGSLEASRRHLVAVLGTSRQDSEAARRSMIRVSIDLHRLRKAEV